MTPDRPNLIITDISRARQQVFTEIATGNWNQLFPGAADAANYDFDLAVHSMAPSFDGTRTYLAYLRGGFGVLDTSRVATNRIPPGTVESLNDDLLTGVPLPTWGAGNRCAGHTAAGCAESHSAVPLPGRPFALTTDEVYGTFTVPRSAGLGAELGCGTSRSRRGRTSSASTRSSRTRRRSKAPPPTTPSPKRPGVTRRTTRR